MLYLKLTKTTKHGAVDTRLVASHESNAFVMFPSVAFSYCESVKRPKRPEMRRDRAYLHHIGPGMTTEF